MKIPSFKDPEVTRYLVDLAKEREDVEKRYLTKNTANHSLLLQAPDNTVWEITVNNSGVLVTTKVAG